MEDSRMFKIETMREYEGGPEPVAYQTKGHVDKAEFAARVRDFCAELDGKSDWFDRTEYTSLDVAHVWYRNVPAGRDAPGCYIMHKCDGPGRGVYPVTEIDVQVACELRQYRAALTA